MTRQRLPLLTVVALLASCTFKFDRSLEAGEIRGHLEIEAADGTRSAAANTQVQLVGSQLTATTNAQGAFVMRNLATGRYTLRVLRKDEAGKQQTALQLSDVAIDAGGGQRGARDVGRLTIEALGGLEGAVTRGSMVVPGAHVVLRSLDQRVTTVEGKYRFTKLPPGKYQVYVLDEEGKLFAGAPREGVPVTIKARTIGTTQLPLQQLVLANGGSVGGHVQVSGGDASGVSVTFSGGPAPVTFTTDDKGHYTGQVAAGVYTVVAHLDGNTDGVLTNFIVDGDQQLPELTLIPLGSPEAPAEPCAQVVGDAQGPCSPNATCTATGDVATCACNSGFDGDGYNCVPPTVGASCADNHGGCDVHATCSESAGEVSCACDMGYSGNGVECADVDECSAQPGPCDTNADCTNHEGSFSCQCHSGYQGDGFTCTTDFCAASPCDPNATCTNGATAATCVCGNGYIGDGTVCAPHFGDVASGTTHACALRSDGSIWCWGANDHGQLGVPVDQALFPRQVGTGYTALTAGGAHTCALQTDQSLWCWGDNASGAAGPPPGAGGPSRTSGTSSTDITTPTQYGTGAWTAVAAGDAHTCGLQADQTLWCWGDNTSGQIGTGDFTSPQGQQRVDTQHTWLVAAAGSGHTCAIRSDGSLWCWGKDDQGQLGDNASGTPQASPVQVGTDTDWKGISAGHDHTCGLRGTAAPYSLWCWGNNARGAVGAGASGMAVSPQHVGSDVWASVTAGNGFTCGRHTDDSLWCWGANDRGQLATGNNNDAAGPTVVMGGEQWTDVAANGSHVCALNTEGALWCWGEGTDGVLGNGTSMDTNQPTEQPVLPTDSCLTLQCATNASCTNRPGQATCTCNLGYSGDGTTSCQPTNPCANGSLTCGLHAMCVETGSTTGECQCAPGYGGDGQNCSPLTLSVLEVQPAGPTVTVGGTAQLTARATYSDQSVADVTSLAVWSSADPGIAIIDSTGVLHGVAAGTVEISATVEGITARTIVTVTGSAMLMGFGLDSIPSALVVGQSAQLGAIAYFSDSTHSDVSASSTWTSDHPEIAQVGPTGLVTGVSPGTAQIEALYMGLTASSSVHVVSPVPDSITISPMNPTVNIDAPTAFVATGHYSTGANADLTHVAVWTSSDNSIATINDGMLQPVAQGVVTITATSGAISGSTTVTVVSLPLVSITVQPLNPMLQVGGSQRMGAIGVYTDNSTRDLTAQVAWTSSNTMVASIDPNGLLRGVGPGSATITATFGAISGTTTVTVNTLPLVSITVQPLSPTVMVGSHLLLSAIGVYSDNSTVDLSSQVLWSTSNVEIATIDPDGMLHPHASGVVTVTAALGPVSGNTVVVITAPDIIGITLSPPSTSVPVGAEVAFTVTAQWTDQTTTDVTTQATWSSSNPSVASIGLQGVLTAVAPGSVTVTATVAGFNATATVTVPLGVTPSAVRVSPGTDTLPVGGTNLLTAIVKYSDASELPALSGVEWSVSDPTVATIDPDGMLHAHSTGTTSVSATVFGLTGVADVTVIAGQVVSISILPVEGVRAGQTTPLVAEATFAAGGQGVISATATWTSSNESIATVDRVGALHALQEGTVTITATQDGVSGSIQVVIGPAAAVPVSIDVTPTSASLLVGQSVRFYGTIHFSDGSTLEQAAMDNWTVSDPLIGQINGTGLFTALNAGEGVITAYSGAVSATATITVTAATLDAITLAGGTSVQTSQTEPLFVTGHYSDSSQGDVTNLCAWATSDALLATVDPNGTFRALGAGTVQVTCTIGGLSDSISITISGLATIGLTLSPAELSLQTNQTQQLSVTATYENATTADVTSQCTWAVLPPEIASVDASGILTALSSGGATVTATCGVLQTSSPITVLPSASVVSIDVQPAVNNVPLGTTVQLYATALMSDSSTLSLGPVALWTSDNPGVASVDSAGFVSTLGQGVATIQAAYGGQTGTASFTVTAPALTGIDVSPKNVNLYVGDTYQFQAVGYYSDGTSQDLTNVVAWTVTNDGLSVSSTGLLHTFGAVVDQVTASYQGFTSSATVTSVLLIPTSVTVTPTEFSIPAGSSQQFTATAHFADGSSKDVTNGSSWVVDNGAAAQIDLNGLLHGLASGSVQVFATYRGVTGNVSGLIQPPQLTGVTVTPPMLVFTVGDTSAYSATATYSDGSSQNITGLATWTSSNPAVAGVTAGLVTATGAGSTSIKATFGAFSDSVNISVNAPSVQSLTLTEDGAHVAKGRNLQMHVIATWSNATTTDVTLSASLSSSDPNVGSLQYYSDPVGWFVRGEAQGSVTISFNYLTASGSGVIYVDPPDLTSISVQPYAGSVPVGQTQQMSATGTYSDSSQADITALVTWSVDNESFATIDSTGLLTGFYAGPVSVTATLGPISQTVPFTVLAPVVVSIAVTPQSPIISPSTPVSLTATATYSDESTADVTGLVVWQSADDSIATMQLPAGTCMGVNPGNVTITATLGTVSGSTTISVQGPVLQSITITPPAPIFLAPGGFLQLTATGNYMSGPPMDISTQVLWSVDNQTMATISPTGMLQASPTASGFLMVTAALGPVNASVMVNINPP